MKTLLSLICCSIFCSVNTNAQQLKNANDSLAYSLGVLVGKNLQREGYANLPMDIFYAALLSSVKDEPLSISAAECDQYVRSGSSLLKMKQFESNKIAGEQCLAKNKTRSGVVCLDDGLQYEVLKMGDGPKPLATDKVLVHYHGTLPDGTVFDSSVDRGEPISFALNQVIKGWTEILQLMPVGSKWKVYIPYQLAYGDRAAGPKVPPYSALIFEIELLKIN